MTPDEPFTATRGHGSRANRKEQAIAALLAEKTHADAAAVCKISLSTLKRWLAEKSFFKAYREAKCDLVNGLIAEYETMAVGCGGRLWVLQKMWKHPRPRRVSAAGKLFDILFRQHENEFIVQRLDQWERERGTDEKGF